MPATDELHEIVAVPELSSVLGVMAVQDNPGGTLSVKLTVPMNPLTGLTWTVIIAEAPAFAAGGEAAFTEKSVTMNLVNVEWDNVPLTPVTVTS